MNDHYFQRLSCVLAILVLSCSPLSAADELSDAETAYFEQHIRPVLVAHCYECHSADAEELQGGLSLDFRDPMRRGGDSGRAIVLGNPDESLLIQALRHDGLEMPPDEKLPERVVADFERWIEMGAPDPRVGGATPTSDGTLEDRTSHWALQSPVAPEIPSVKKEDWVRGDIDRFVLSRLEQESLQPAPTADRYTWLRRVSFDLTGLPPTIAEIEEFAADDSPDAYEKVVDRLLDSRAFGERWARYWLDLVGYADQRTPESPMYAHHAWRYRDWVIKSFNEDMPFDVFARKQLAGDLLPYESIPERRENLIATGFLVLGELRIEDYDKLQLHVDTLDSQVSKVGKAFLGLTLECARCHDHKFDAISRDDYYAIAGIFDSTSTLYRSTVGIWSEVNEVLLPETPAQIAERIESENENSRKLQRLEAEMVDLQKRRKTLEAAIEEANPSDRSDDRTGSEQTDLAQTTVGNSTAPDQVDPSAKEREELEEVVKKIGTQEHAIRHASLLVSKRPMAYGVQDLPEPKDMRITIRGNPRALGDAVPRGVLSFFPNKGAEIPPGTSGRLQLADWIVSPENPLTARVVVNRIWQKLMGAGLHRNVDYFGIPEGEPSHPELLDHLALEFMDDGWSQKRAIRSIALSQAYRMSSQHNASAHEVDPENRLLWRMNRSRMDAEAIRDALLAAAGDLKSFSGGPTVPFDDPRNIINIGRERSIVNTPWFLLRELPPDTQFYRTVYLPIIRGPQQPDVSDLRNVFDFTTPSQTAGQRPVTTVPTQALYLMNSPQARKYAERIAKRVCAEHEDDEARLRMLWLSVFNRPVSDAELVEAQQFLAEGGDRSFRELCHALMTSGEFLMRI